MVDMVNTAFIPAFAQDLALYKDAPDLAGDRKASYASVKAETEKLAQMTTHVLHIPVRFRFTPSARRGGGSLAQCLQIQ